MGMFFFFLFFCLRSTDNTANSEDVTTTSNNSTQTPSDLSPPGPNEEILPQAHHQNPGHCVASFAAINQMRTNSQVSPRRLRPNAKKHCTISIKCIVER